MVFCAAMPLLAWLWRQNRQLPRGIGEVQVVHVPIRTPYAGVLAALESGPLRLFDQVQQGQALARLDDGQLQATLAALRAENERLEAELTAEAARQGTDEADRGYDRLTENRRLMVDVESSRVRVLSLQTQIEADKVSLARTEKLLDSSEKLLASGAATRFEVEDLRLRCDQTRQRLTGAVREVAQAELDVKAAQERLAAQPATRPAELQAYLAPIRKSREAQEARVRELELQIAATTIRAPISGTISAVLRDPGQVVLAGDDIMLIASESSRHILTYVRENQGIQPEVGMKVLVRPRTDNAGTIPTVVLRVGAAVEEVPAHQRVDPSRPEWGLPVLIAAPQEADLVPGQLVGIALGG